MNLELKQTPGAVIDSANLLMSVLEPAHANNDSLLLCKRSSKKIGDQNRAFGGSCRSYLTCIRTTHVHGRSHRSLTQGPTVAMT